MNYDRECIQNVGGKLRFGKPRWQMGDDIKRKCTELATTEVRLNLLRIIFSGSDVTPPDSEPILL